MVINSTRSHWRAHFDSVADVVAFLENTPRKWADPKTFTLEGHYGKHEWTLGHGEQDVRRFAREGWHDGVKQLDQQLVGRPPANEKTSTWRYDVAGYLPDVQRFLSGDPACMMRHGHPKGHRPVISLCVQVWINSGVNAQQMVNYGAAMVALIDQLEQSGRRVELWAGVIAPHTLVKDVMSATWTVKAAQDHVDMADVAFSLAHPGASRRFGWRIWERSDRPYDPGYGRGGYTATLADVLDPPPGMLFLPGVANQRGRGHTMEDAVKLVAEQINLAAGETLVEVEG